MGQLDPLALPLLTPQKRIVHPKGDILHAMKASGPGFAGFGEAYFTTILYGETKGWKKHLRMQMNLVVPMGEVCFYLYDELRAVRSAFLIGDANYARLTVPPGYWVAFRGVGQAANLVLNLANIEHDPDEAVNVALEHFPLEGSP